MAKLATPAGWRLFKTPTGYFLNARPCHPGKSYCA
jgi:hypothetical protein